MKKTNRKSERGLVRHSKRQREAGSALVYILIAIALLAALTVTFMEPSSQQTTSQSAFRSTAALQGQIDTIRSAVQECVLRYSNGDGTVTSATDPGARQEYPLRPSSAHLTNPAGTAGSLVRDIRCPGNPEGGVVTDHAAIFGGSTGKFMPAAPDLFNDWQWYNGTDGVFFWISTSNSDAFLRTSLEKLDDRFSECEADIIDATGGLVDMDSDTPNEAECTAGQTCFRVWMIQNATATYQAGSTEDSSC